MKQDLQVFNTLSRKKEKFEPINPPHVGLYVCGPTVYNYMHLGNLRTFITFDMVYRYLVFLGYKVRYVRNITDVGHITSEYDDGVDRIGKQARLEQLEPMEVVQKYTNNFHEVLNQFNCIPPSIEPTATGHIIEQIEMIRKIIDNGFAYVVDGSVYFDVKAYMQKFPYGELSGRNVEELLENTRELDGQEDKRFFADFALWKKAAPEHIMHWPSPWSEGFPGWHLECSAMSTKYLGEQFDIHGGGMDLKFPHHESEIAQNTACVGHGPVKYWMHGNMLTVNGAKMSKSVGNSFLPHELISGDHPMLEQGYSEMTVRFFMMQSHYASTLDFSNEALKAAEKGFKRLMTAVEAMNKIVPGDASTFSVNDLERQFYAAMNDDFNTPVLIAHLFEAVRLINLMTEGKEKLSSDELLHFKTLVNGFVFAVLGFRNENGGTDTQTLDAVLQMVIELRKEAKANKDFTTADAIRDKLKAAGIVLKDTKDGVEWMLEN